MSSPVLWCEISDSCEKSRFELLSKELTELGVANQVEFIETTEAAFGDVLSAAKKKFQQIRIGGIFRELIFKSSEGIPSTLLPLKFADAIVSEAAANGELKWWPRNYMAEGYMRSLNVSLDGIDLSGGVFCMGATPECRAVVSALSRVGFRKFTISDVDESRVTVLIDELKKSYFGVQFQQVPSHLVTQLPTVNSIAVNTTSITDDATLAELSFFNFLKPGGIWLDVSQKTPRENLAAEAQSIGATIHSSVDVLVETDRAWVEACFGKNLESKRYSEALGKV